MGHIPIFMATATAAASIVPLAAVEVHSGLALALMALALIGWGAFAGWQASRRQAFNRAIKNRSWAALGSLFIR